VILDSSAVVAVLAGEAGHDPLLEAMDGAESLAIGSPTLVESEIVLVARLGAAHRGVLAGFVADRGIEILPFGEDHWREAVNAFLRFGKGRHPAALNLGDCMTYATARLAGEPLLHLGDDFTKTDLELAS
jgi:ribonuclease VapC